MIAPKVGQTTVDTSLGGRRDAFHVPGVLVTSNAIVDPGDSVRFVDNGCTRVEPCSKSIRDAIVDPFISVAAAEELFWVFLIPDRVSNLVHHFDLQVGAQVANPAPPTAPAQVPSPPAVEDDGDADDDASCAGCYGDDEFDEDEEEEDACKGCYS